MIRKKAVIFYIVIIVILIVTTIIALLIGDYHIVGRVVAGIAFGSIITSLIPFFLSISLFDKYETKPIEKAHLKVWGMVLYAFSFPVKIWLIYSNIDLFINGGNGWNFG